MTAQGSDIRLHLSKKMPCSPILDIILNHLHRCLRALVEGDAEIFYPQLQQDRLAHYTDSLYKSYEDCLISSEWQAALRLRQHKSQELDALKKRLSSQKGDARDYSMKIFELHKQLTLDDKEAQFMEGDKDQFLGLALKSYQS